MKMICHSREQHYNNENARFKTTVGTDVTDLYMEYFKFYSEKFSVKRDTFTIKETGVEIHYDLACISTSKDDIITWQPFLAFISGGELEPVKIVLFTEEDRLSAYKDWTYRLEYELMKLEK